MTAPVAARSQKAEGLILFAVGLGLVLRDDAGLGWWTLIVFFAPDLSFAAYALGNRAGAAVYNCLHTYGGGAVLLGLGLILQMPLLAALGALWLAHCGFDRMLGYGLKSPEGFGITHLGRIGPPSTSA